MQREQYVSRLMEAYRRYYDIIPADSACTDDASPEVIWGSPPPGLVCRCDFSVRNAQYVLSKKHELWSAESKEHCYLFSIPQLTETAYRAMERYVYEEGMKLIHPGKGHMCTTLTLIIVCDGCTPEAERLLKKCRLHKSFRFSLDGWMDFHTALMTLDSGKPSANFSGHDNLKLLKRLLR